MNKTLFKTEKIAVANEICNMIENNIIMEVGVEPFENWCEDGYMFDDYDNLDKPTMVYLMKQVSKYVDKISYILNPLSEE